MSVVAAVVDSDGVIHMAADRLVSTSDWKGAIVEPKVFIYKHFAFGVTGSGRVNNVIYSSFKPPGNIQADPLVYMTTDFVDVLRRTLERANVDLHERDSDGERHESFDVLVGYQGKLYCVDPTFQVIQFRDNFFAIGAGSSYALGVLWRTRDYKDSERRVRDAVKAANYFCPSCGGGVLYERLG